MSRTPAPAPRNGQPPASPARALFDLIEGNRAELTKLLGTDTKTDRFIRILRNAVLTDPSLADRDHKSLIQCAMRAAELKLEPGGIKGHAYFVPFGRDVQLVLGWKGLIEIAYRSGLFQAIGTREVYDRDEFGLEYDPEPRLSHRPSQERDPGPVVRVYAYGRLSAGGMDLEVMRHDQVEQIRKLSKSGNSPAWRDHWVEMARKIVLKRFLKRYPMSDDLAAALDLDNAVDGLEAIQRPAGLPPAATRSQALAQSLGALPGPEEDRERPGEDSYDFPVDERPELEGESA